MKKKLQSIEDARLKAFQAGNRQEFERLGREGKRLEDQWAAYQSGAEQSLKDDIDLKIYQENQEL